MLYNCKYYKLYFQGGGVGVVVAAVKPCPPPHHEAHSWAALRDTHTVTGCSQFNMLQRKWCLKQTWRFDIRTSDTTTAEFQQCCRITKIRRCGRDKWQ